MNLYEISLELAAILNGEELTDDEAARLSDLELALEAKVEGILQFRQGLLAEAEAIEGEAKRLKARADAMTRRADWLKGYLLSAMQQTGVGKISTLTFTATVAKSPPKAECEGDIPERYQRVKTIVELDRSGILADFKAGTELPDGVKVTSGFYLKVT